LSAEYRRLVCRIFAEALRLPVSDESNLYEQRILQVGQHLALGAVAVVGAGLSIHARFPVTGGLNTLLWDALDSDQSARLWVAEQLGRPDARSKDLLGDDWDEVVVGWRAIGSSPDGRVRFQNQFAHLDADRAARPSPAHEALACLIHAGVVQRVVSLNWDTALERAYQRLYGVSIPDGVLFKPHGDAFHPEDSWTLPDEAGVVPEVVLSALEELDHEYVRTLLVIGYSERDSVVVQKMIAPLD
jgi:hypothetical protein